MTGPELRDALKTLGIRQQWLAERLGVQPQTVNAWAAGRLDVPQYAVAYLALLAQLRRAEGALTIAATMIPELRDGITDAEAQHRAIAKRMDKRT